ncbi:MAG TPA: hypothetical protein PKL78_01795 [Anaerolineales bacterium]|nr:hypothetical protein [Anaerolineales bacterium]
MKTFKPENLIPLGISVLLVGLLFAWQGNKGFNLADEGFLWYGVQRVMLGEVPIRDFMAYDPGRYYWSAAIMSALGGDGIMNLRFAIAVFYLVGMNAGMLLFLRPNEEKETDLPYFLVTGLILVMWIYPRFKVFDISVSILLIYALTRLIENPTRKRYFVTGFWIGLAAVFGRNHGIYGVAACLGVIMWLNLKRRLNFDWIKEWMAWIVGVVTGFLPAIFMLLFIPGFAGEFWQSIFFLFDQKATNLALPVPWPWRLNYATLPFMDGVHETLLGLYFISLLVFGALALSLVVYRRLKDKPVPAVLVASAFLAFPYAHYAFSRADLAHLTQGIYPLLIGCLAFFSTQPFRRKWISALTLLLTGLLVMYPVQPGWQCLTGKCVAVEVSGDTLQVRPAVAREVAFLRDLADKYAPNGESFLATPYLPGAYALLERRSPMYENYAFFLRSEAFEREEISRIQASNPAFVLILDVPLDDREDLRFKSTHPLVNQYILENFDAVPDSPNPIYQIFIPRGLTP